MFPLSGWAPRLSALVVALLPALVIADTAGCGCNVSSVTAQTSPVPAGIAEADPCLRTAKAAIDFDGQFWVLSPLTTAGYAAINSCASPTGGQGSGTRGTLTLVSDGQARWSMDSQSYDLKSVGRTEEDGCG